MGAARAAGVTVIFVEHDMDIVARYAARVVAFYDGGIIGDGPPDDGAAHGGRAPLRDRRGDSHAAA